MSRRSKSEKPFGVFRVTPRGLVPVTAFDAELMNQYAYGSELELTLHQQKNEKLFRLYWVVLGKILDCTEYPTTAALSNVLKIRCGYAESLSLIGGGLWVNPKSLAEMEGPEFNEFFDRAMFILSSELIPGLDIDRLIKDIRSGSLKEIRVHIEG